MVSIHKVPFYSRLQIPKQLFTHSEDVLLIGQSNFLHKMETKFSLFIQKHREENIHLVEDEFWGLAVSLRLMNKYDIKRELAIPLEVTREMIE